MLLRRGLSKDQKSGQLIAELIEAFLLLFFSIAGCCKKQKITNELNFLDFRDLKLNIRGAELKSIYFAFCEYDSARIV